MHPALTLLTETVTRMQAPMSRYAATLAEKAARQRALRSTGEMTLEVQGGDGEEDSGDEEAGLPIEAIMPQVHHSYG